MQVVKATAPVGKQFDRRRRAALVRQQAYVVLYHILFVAGATNLLLVTLLTPATTLALGIAFLGKRLNVGVIIGTGIIGLSLVGIDGRLLGNSQRSSSDEPTNGRKGTADAR